MFFMTKIIPVVKVKKILLTLANVVNFQNTFWITEYI